VIKIIFSDFDNTMLDYYSVDNYFDDYKISILKKIQDKGIKFCIVTGRSVPFFKQFSNLFEVVDYIIGSNGACIYDVKNNKFINQRVVEESDFDKIIDYTLNNDGGFLLNCCDKRFKYGVWDVIEGYDYDKDDIYFCEQIILSFDKAKLGQVLNFLETFENICVNNISYMDNLCIIDVNASDVSKGSAVSWLCSYLSIDRDNAMAFGDGENDRSLFMAINKGVAVGNAIDKLKILSKDVAADCVDNGIYKYIEDNILK
jgi:HAD superfamily hydrolase (TIGR01484 family)